MFYVAPDCAPTFSDLQRAGLERYTVTCRKCDRKGVYGLRKAIAERGDLPLAAVLSELRKACPVSDGFSIYAVCGVTCPDLSSVHPPVSEYVPQKRRGER